MKTPSMPFKKDLKMNSGSTLLEHIKRITLIYCIFKI
ncbi:hypothetical protein DESC_580045 [Desulfosarcina cetonica]|nr:hypothetical protein DESC_580045 [Desulfosarcina cetonica]